MFEEGAKALEFLLGTCTQIFVVCGFVTICVETLRSWTKEKSSVAIWNTIIWRETKKSWLVIVILLGKYEGV